MRTTRDYFSIAKESWKDFSDDRCPRAAAALAYYTIFALPPLLVLVLSILGLIVDPEDVRGELIAQVKRFMGSEGAEQIQTMLENAHHSEQGWLAAAIGLVVLLAGATAVVIELQDALNTAWEVKPDPRQGGVRLFITKRVISFAMILSIAFLLLISLVITTIIALLNDRFFGSLGDAAGVLVQGINFVVSFIIITALFAVMFKFLPDAKIRWNEVWVGSILTSLLFVIGKFALGTYLGRKDLGSTYGAAGSLALILLWVYYSGLIFFYGAEFTQTWAKWQGHQIEPEKGAVRVVQTEDIVEPSIRRG